MTSSGGVPYFGSKISLISKSEMRYEGILSPIDTGKSFSEGLVLTSTNPQYDKRLSIELPVQCMKIPSSEHCQNMLCTQIVLNVKTKTNLCTKHVLSLEFSCTELVIQ